MPEVNKHVNFNCKYPRFLTIAKNYAMYLQSLNVQLDRKRRLIETYKNLSGYGNSNERLIAIISELDKLIERNSDEILNAIHKIDYAQGVLSLLAEIDPEAASVIRLYFCENMLCEEVSHKLFISERSFYNYLKRGIKTLLDKDLENKYNKEVSDDGC